MYEERWYQLEAEKALYDYFATNRGNPIIALPTGTGKSVVLGRTCANAIRRWPNQRFLMATHVKKLIEQNAQKLLDIWPSAPLGICSAGLGERTANAPIVYGGVATLRNMVPALGHRDIFWIDECHLVSPDEETMYAQLIKELTHINPKLKVVGMSATPFRMGQGLLTNGGIFTDICYDVTGVESFNRLITEGFLSPLIPKKTKVEIDVSGIAISKGEYKAVPLEEASDKITYEALCELLEFSANRVCGLIFATGIKHAEHIHYMLTNHFGQSSVVIHSGNKKFPRTEAQNDKDLERWLSGQVKWAVNMNALTTGIDNPMIDVIGCLRPTISSVLWVQMLGRGTRPCPHSGKRNCLVMDFAGNTKRLGPINDPRIPKKKGEGTGEIPIRICEACGCYNHLSARYCINCGEEFTFQIKYSKSASTDELLRDTAPIVEFFNVDYVIYGLHEKTGSPPSIKVSYFCGLQKFDEWVCLEHEGYAKSLAHQWWLKHHRSEPPTKTADALAVKAELRKPKRIRVHVNKSFPEVLSYEY